MSWKRCRWFQEFQDFLLRVSLVQLYPLFPRVSTPLLPLHGTTCSSTTSHTFLPEHHLISQKESVSFTFSSRVLTYNFVAASYGILSIGLSFVVGRLGTVLQASIAISGSIRGPLLALFVLAFFFPSCNSKGGVFGTILGVSCSLFIALMTIVYPRQQTSLPASTDGCSNETYLAYGDHNRTILQLPWDYHPE